MAALAINSGTVYAESRSSLAGRVEDLIRHVDAIRSRMDDAADAGDRRAWIEAALDLKAGVALLPVIRDAILEERA